MKIFIIDWNNMTPQYVFPLIHSMKKNHKINITFITNTKSKIDILFNYSNSISIKEFITFNFYFSIVNKALKPFILFFNYLILYKKIKLMGPLILHFNWLSFPLIDLFFIKFFKSLQCKIILTQHNYYQHSKSNLRLGEKLIFQTVDQIICLSQFVKNQFNNEFYNKISIIPHRNCYEGFLNKKKNKHKNKIVTLLLIGNIKNYKGIELMIEVINYLKLNNYSIFLNICGAGNYTYVNQINKKIISKNLIKNISLKNKFLSFDQLCNYINSCDIGLLPYKRVSQSGIPYLFSFYNKPMVITDVGGLSEQINPSFCNISKYNVKIFSKSIINMIDKIKNKKINKISYKKFLDDNKWDKTIKEYLLEYKKHEN